jgi:signal transduction histidine kinase
VERRTVSHAGQPVGTVQVGFASGGLSASELHLRSSLGSAVGWSALIAAVGALVVAVVIARGLVRPIRRLLGAVRAFKLDGTAESPHPPATSPDNLDQGSDRGPGELGELARAFDELTASLQREDRLRRVLIADVAHELRTPIAVLQAETEALLDGLREPSPDALTSLRDETVRVGRMVDDLQVLASAEAAGLQLERRRLDLARIGAEAADSLASRYQAAGVTLDQDLPPTVVVGDPGRLHQVVTNLLANALKFTPAGGRVTLTIQTDGEDAVLEVVDTGPGVPPAEQSLVWERFYRGQAGRATGGSGIGLAVVKELVAAHGGTVALHSPPAGGAAFEVRLPVACAA